MTGLSRRSENEPSRLNPLLYALALLLHRPALSLLRKLTAVTPSPRRCLHEQTSLQQVAYSS